MKWLFRGFWLIAWCVWLWLGFGLYRELPREIGPPISRLALRAAERVGRSPPPPPEQIVGFLDGDDLVVTRFSGGWSAPTNYRLWNPRTGAVLHQIGGPAAYDETTAVSLQFGVALGANVKAWSRDQSRDSMESLNLRTGEWKPIGLPPSKNLDFHPTEPWAVVARKPNDERSFAFAVFNVRTGDKIAERKGETPPGECIDFIQSCWFLGGDELLLFLERNESATSMKVDQRLVRWSIANGRIAPAIPLRQTHLMATKPTNGGRMMLAGTLGKAETIDVVDCRTAESAFSIRTAEFADEPQLRDMRGPKLSKSGRALFAWSGNLWSVDKPRRLWSPLAGVETLQPPASSADSFLVDEQWQAILQSWRIPWNRPTTAVRDFDTGALRYRVWDSHPPLHLVSSDGKLAVTEAGLVFEMPPPPNWLLISIGQSILALPIILLWIILRWRRKRKPTS